MIRKEAWSFYRTISGVRLCWELEEPKGPKGVYSGQAPMTSVPWVPCSERAREAFVSDQNQHDHHIFPSLKRVQGYLADKKTAPLLGPP